MKKLLEKIKDETPVGMRTIKTAISIVLCLFVYQLGYALGLASSSDAILACITAIICMRESMDDSRTVALQRLFGTIIGVGFGLAYSYLFFFLQNSYLQMFIIATGVIGIIVICNKAKVQEAIFLGCMAYLFIALQQGEINPLIHSISRFIATLIGLGISILVNHFIRNPDKRKDDDDNDEEDV